jgi:transcriptional regulator with XRE-family HTH domain
LPRFYQNVKHWSLNDKDSPEKAAILDIKRGDGNMTADRIKALREARGWTQAELARKMNMTRNGINSWEQGLSMPSPPSLVDLARLFSVSTDYLLGVENYSAVNVTGLNEADVALLAQLADRLRESH